jgi:transcriptional regulator with XRE-family HTH domain
MARRLATDIGQEVGLARANHALTVRAAARLAGVSPETQRRVEEGSPSVRLETACRVAGAIGLKVWARAFPVREPTLRDTGQLRIAEQLRSMAHSTYRVVIEQALGNGRSIDTVFLGPTEIIALEIHRLVADLQAQYRAATAKRDELAASHQRPVRLVLVLEDTRRNRRVVGEHGALIRSMLPGDSRDVLRSLRSGGPLGLDGLLWIRPTTKK